MNFNRELRKLDSLDVNAVNEKSGIVFTLFCIWTVVNLSRPQDIIPIIAVFRPALMMGVLTITVYWFSNKNKRQPLLKEKQVKYFFLFLSVLILTIPFSIYAKLSFEVVMLKYLFVAAYFVMFVLLVNSLEKLYKVIFLACIGSGVYSIFSVLTGSHSSHGGRLSFGAMFDPNDLSFFTLCFIPLFLIFISKDNKLIVRLLSIVGFSFGILLIILSSSRGGALGLGIAFSALFFRHTISIGKSFKIIIVIAVSLVLSVSDIDTTRLETLFSIDQDYNVTAEGGRLDLWGTGFKVLLQNPFTGVGPGCFAPAVSEYRISHNSEVRKWQTAHNSVVQIGTETGFFGLFLFLLLSWRTVKIFARVSREATSVKLKKIGETGLAGFLGMFAAAFFLSQAYSMYWAFYIMFSAVAFRLLSIELAVQRETEKR